MRWKDRRISELVLKKSNSYLRISIGLFLLTLIMLAFFYVYTINEQKEKKTNFINNDNIHIIRLEGKVIDGAYQPLTNLEGKRVESLLRKKGYDHEYEQITVFKMVGICDKSKRDGIEVFGLSKKAGKWIIGSELEDGTLYTKRNTAKRLELCIPNIKMKKGGVESDSYDMIQLNWKGGMNEKSPLLLYKHDYSGLQQAYVTENTFLRLLKKMYKKNNSVDSLYRKELSDIVNVDEIVIYVKDVYQIDNIAKILDNSGYCTTYTFQAFDSFGMSLLRSNIILVCLMLVMVLISATNLIFSFWSYLKVQQKDMGILCFYGYSSDRLYRIYKRNINRIFAMVGGITMLLCGGIWLLVVKDGSFFSLLLILCLLAVVILLVKQIILWGPLKNYLHKSLLELVKQSKEFE